MRVIHPQNWIARLRPVFRLYIALAARVARPDPNLILCGAMNGLLYGDNSRHLFEWILANRPDLKPLWLTRSHRVYRELRRKKLPVVFCYSLAGLRALARARVAVFTDNLQDLAMDPWIVPDTLRLIALRHGRSVKRVRFARLGHKITESEARVRRYEARLIRYAISTSDFISELQEVCLELGAEKHAVTGYPRNDVLLEVPEASRRTWERFLAGRRFEKVVLYAPSWRHGRYYTRIFPFDDFDLDALEAFLEEHNWLLLLRPHRLDLNFPENRARIEELSRKDNIELAIHDELPDVNSFLPFVDSLVCDYSALYHDYLLMDRPMIFVPYDVEDFEKHNGFLYPYFENLPGPAVWSFAEFMEYMHELAEGRDTHRDARHRLRDKIHRYRDARSSERVMALIDRVRANRGRAPD